MIEATASRAESGYCLEVIGHAEYARENDIVCAGVSALVEALAAYLEEFDDGGAEVDLADGYASITLPAPNAAFDMVICGLCAIADQYPGYVNMRNTYTSI